jgi:putative ABC transport system permease protein
MMSTLIQDLKFGLRMLAKNPGFTVVAVLTLALGIGAVTAMFSVIEGAVLDPFPYADTHRMATVVVRYPAYGPDYYWGWFPVQEFLDYRNQNHVFDEVIGSTHDQYVLTGVDVPVAFNGLRATGNLFHMVGVPPLMGRTFTPADAVAGAPPVAVVSHKTWQGTFGGDAKIIGRTLLLNGQPTTVIGVMPPRFRWQRADLWLPESFTGGRPTDHQFYVCLVGHLKPGVTIEQAAAEVAVLSRSFAALYPKDHPKGAIFSAQLLTDAAVGPEPHRIFYILFGAVGLLLGIACVNVANLLLARATSRETEIAIRSSLGAGRLRLVRQFMVESLLLALGGALLGCMLAWLGLKALVAIIPRWEIPGEAVIRINGPVLLFTVGVALAGTLLFGLAPALHAVRRDFQADLRSGGRGAGGSRSYGRLRNLLVVSEITLSLVLLTGAGLLIRSFFAIRYAKLGYDPNNILAASLNLPESRYKTTEQRNQFSMELLRRLRAMPGVVSAVIGVPSPVWASQAMGIEIPGKPSQENWRAQMHGVSDGIFATLRIPLLEGRDITEEDFKLARRVAVINQSFVRKYFADQNPLGREIIVKQLTAPPHSAKSPSFEIVGVTGDIRDNGPDQPSQPAMYIPYTVLGVPWGTYLIRTAVEPGLLLNSLRREVASADKELPLEGEPLQDILKENYFTEPRFVMTLMSVFAALGLALVLIGVYSVLSYSVTRRTHEIGVRMALGAKAADVRWMVIKAGLRWLLAGIGLGVVASIGLARVLAHRIWGLKSADPLTLAVVAVLLMAVGLAACYFPARRATKVDPMVALRYE